MSISKDYQFQYSQNYDFTDAKIELVNGNAQLRGTSSSTTYSTSDPYITPKESLVASDLNSFTETSILGTSEVVQYIMNVDNQDKYWDGAAWINSNGAFAQSNLVAIVNTNIGSLVSDRSRFKFKSFLHTTVNTTTPSLTNVNVSYDFTGYSSADDVRATLINIDNDTIKDEEIIQHIEQADDVINMYVSMQYELPVSGASATSLLRTFSIQHASYNIFSYFANKEGKNLPSLTVEKYNKLLEILEKIGSGEIPLTNLIDITRFDISTIDYDPTFDLGSTESWDVDSSLLGDISTGSWNG